MPTWRNSLVGNLIKGTTRSLNKNFMNSDYAKKWSHFLASQNLLKLLRVYGYRLQFFPHAYIQPYIKYFNLPKYIEICTHRTHRFQEVIGSAAIMITDYSSAAFDIVYLETLCQRLGLFKSLSVRRLLDGIDVLQHRQKLHG